MNICRSSYNNLANTDENERQRQDASNIRYLHLLRAMIHNEIVFINPDIRKGQNPALFRKYKDLTIDMGYLIIFTNRQSERLQTVQKTMQSFGNTVKRV